MSRLLVQFTDLTQSFRSLPVFDGISLSVNQGDRFALIGENGAGKTTLLKIVAGNLAPDQGLLSRAANLSVGFLPQEVVVESSAVSVRDYLEDSPLSKLEEEMSACLEDPDRLTQWEQLHETYERLGGYQKMPIETALKGLKLQEELLDEPLSLLSSGQKVRVALAKALIQNPDLLLLDEPTNHLDKEMLEWLQQSLLDRKGATVIVSHHRRFLNETCNHLIEIKDKKLACYGGNYDFYLEERERALQKEIKAYHQQKEEKALIKQQIKATTFSKRRPGAPSDRNVMAYDKRGEKHQKSVQRNLNTLKCRLEEIENSLISNPKPKSILGMRFPPNPLPSPVAIELDQIEKSFGEKRLFSQLNRTIYNGERIIIHGPNGCGKTTLLKCLAGQLSLDRGNIRYSPSVKIAYLEQEANELPMEQTPLQYFEKHYRLTEEDLRSELHKAALSGAELLSRPFSTQSVGQRKRLMLLTLLLERPNILLLDEPTNHLDLMAIEALEEALIGFQGTLIAISHDPTFTEKIGKQVWRAEDWI